MEQHEKDQLVSEVIEQVLIRMPEVIGNLMQNHAMLLKLNKKFYDDNKDFQGHKEIVVKSIEEMEGNNPHLKYEEILTKVVPVIKDRIKILDASDTNSVTEPDAKSLSFSDKSFKASNGDL